MVCKYIVHPVHRVHLLPVVLRTPSPLCITYIHQVMGACMHAHHLSQVMQRGIASVHLGNGAAGARPSLPSLLVRMHCMHAGKEESCGGRTLSASFGHALLSVAGKPESKPSEGRVRRSRALFARARVVHPFKPVVPRGW